MGQVIAWAFLSALNPTLLAATTVMLLSPRPLRLMVGYWLGAMFIGLTLGLVIVFALEGSSTVNTTKNTVSPIADFVLAAIFLVLAAVLARGRDKNVEGRRQSRRAREGHGQSDLRDRRRTLAARRHLSGRTRPHRQTALLHCGHRACRDRLQPGIAAPARDPDGRLQGGTDPDPDRH
jgi:Sap, sulfolipid-1-addressing protein